MGTSTGQAPFKARIERIVPAVAGGADDSTVLFRMPFAGTIASVSYVAESAITGADTNTRKVDLINKGQAGSGTVNAASLQFNSGVNAAAFDEKAVTLSGTAANLDAAEGDVLAWVSTHVGTGIADPGGMVIVEIARD